MAYDSVITHSAPRAWVYRIKRLTIQHAKSFAPTPHNSWSLSQGRGLEYLEKMPLLPPLCAGESLCYVSIVSLYMDAQAY